MVNPYKVKMKEFTIFPIYECGYELDWKTKRKIKIHLCDDCYQGIGRIANKRSDEE